MKRLAVVGLFSLAAWDCGGLYDLGCQGVVIGSQQLDFESPCTGADCSVATLGATTTVPSLLPGDHALALFPAASLTWTLGLPGNGDGTSLAMSYRCDEGGALRVELPRYGGDPLPIEPTVDWHRRVWPIVSMVSSFSSIEAARTGRHEAVVRVTNTGRAPCAVDWLRYVAAPRVCSNPGACSDLVPNGSFCNGACVDFSTSDNHCGGCGRACGSETHCEFGVCRPGSALCPRACDLRECGPDRCGRASCGTCPANAGCSLEGRCVVDAGVPWDTGVPDAGARRDAGAPREAVVAGRRCATDDACLNLAVTLTCVALPGGRVCSGAAGCAQGTTAAEETACGGRYSTCLVVGAGEDGGVRGACTRACVASATTEAQGACPTGSVCTTSWLALAAGQVESPGCLPFCASDADCAGATEGDASLARCNARTGRCGEAPVDPALRADGQPCDPAEVARTRVAQCRGTCFALSAERPTEGLCGSLLDLRATSTCPDDGIAPTAPAGDQLAACVLRACADNGQCPPGVVCVHPEDAAGVRVDQPASCRYPTARQPVGIVGDAGVALDARAMD